MPTRFVLCAGFLLLAPVIIAEQPVAAPVTIHVDAARAAGALKPIWVYFGYDEPNYTYMKHGKRLVAELAALSPFPVYLRTHNLLTTGDGAPALKWGSTNAYTEDASGRAVYDWTIVDKIMDTYREAGTRPFVEIGFMPEALSTQPQPYQHHWPTGPLSTGWAYPPKDYNRWAELIHQWVRHSIEKYGRPDVERWYWEVWNEPDGGYWHGTPEEYDKLYDYTADAVKRALPTARVGGPATTGPSGQRAANFLRQFLEHCSSGRNFATGTTGAPLDFITFHAKGRPSVVDGHVRMGIAKNIEDVEKGFEIVSAFPKFRTVPIVLSETDPEGCAACSARGYPQNAYRNGPLYPAYTAVMLKNILELADRAGTNIEGMLTWAFEFEDQPYFDGFRTLATNGIDKPVLNLFRMAGLIHGNRVEVESSGRVAPAAMVAEGVRGTPDIDALAARSDRELSVLMWNYHDDDVPAEDARVRLIITGMPDAARRALLRHYRIDRTHSNAYSLWKQLGSPPSPTPEQYMALEAAGQLQEFDSPRWIEIKAAAAELTLTLPRQGTSLVQLSW